MARILLSGRETSVSEGVEEVLARIVASKDGIRNSSGNILAPPGWVTLTAGESGEQLYVQTEHIGYVREDY
ncbi:MAG TPA: hypothetical protein VMF09_02940 [Solirubrobacteraceae bacterium]|nr:hypothetical protein [Solirubrobacteraceae bacterium]